MLTAAKAAAAIHDAVSAGQFLAALERAARLLARKQPPRSEYQISHTVIHAGLTRVIYLARGSRRVGCARSGGGPLALTPAELACLFRRIQSAAQKCAAIARYLERSSGSDDEIGRYSGTADDLIGVMVAVSCVYDSGAAAAAAGQRAAS